MIKNKPIKKIDEIDEIIKMIRQFDMSIYDGIDSGYRGAKAFQRDIINILQRIQLIKLGNKLTEAILDDIKSNY